MKLIYKGAGLLLAGREDGRSRVLLGRRAYNPGRDTWSIPGGAMEPRDQGDFWACACRETREELRDWPVLARALHALPQPPEPCFRTNLLFYQWRTYPVAVPVLELPTSWSREFSELRWFPVTSLPANLHTFLRGAIGRLDWEMRQAQNMKQ